MDGKKVETNSLGNQTLHGIGLSKLVKDFESRFLVDVEDDIEIVDLAKVTLVPDDSAFFRKSKVYIESQWREKFQLTIRFILEIRQQWT